MIISFNYITDSDHSSATSYETITTAREPSFMTLQSFCDYKDQSEREFSDSSGYHLKPSPLEHQQSTRTARSPQGRSHRVASPRPDPLTPLRSPPRRHYKKKKREQADGSSDIQTAVPPHYDSGNFVHVDINK